MTGGLRYISLFSGMEAAALALEPRGWECAAVAEVDRDASAVLAHRMDASCPRYLPDGSGLDPDPWDPKRYARIAWGERLPNLGDVSQVTYQDVEALGPLDVVIGGSPCQDLSVAGKRAGLAGTRSSLFHEQLRIFNAARTLCGARWLVWENVPGAFSSHARRDFACVVGALAGVDVAPPDRWGYEGVALGPRGFVEWCVLDAQWFGVAQRRRRVFAVLDSGDWASRPPVLLEPDSLRGDSAPERDARKDLAGALTARAGVRGSVGTDEAAQGFLVAAASPDGANMATLKASSGKSGNNGMTLLAFDTSQVTCPKNRCNPQDGDPCHPLVAAGHPPAVAIGFNAQQDPDSWTERAGPLACTETQAQAVSYGYTVRRLTPRECERLQGAPDDHTLVPIGRKMMADGPRYRMVGNSFAAPCIAWIGQRIEMAHWWSA
jgi:DNA (cytosine-5)-methyltransferase 1